MLEGSFENITVCLHCRVLRNHDEQNKKTLILVIASVQPTSLTETELCLISEQLFKVSKHFMSDLIS